MDPTCCESRAPPGSAVQVCFPGSRAAVLDNLNRQREEGRLCDLSIQVQGHVFRAHRCVLAASSPYFHDQVLLKNVTTVSLPSVMDPVAFQSVLSSAYTGQLSIVCDDIVNYVTVASFLQMWHIVDKCTEILKRRRPCGEAPEAPPASASRQQSPSSTECLYVELEGRRAEKKPDALPPLATWRRPQQATRWVRPRNVSAQNSADSQLDGLSGFLETNPASCEEAWPSDRPKTEGAGQNSRQLEGALGGDALKQRLREAQRGAPSSSDRVKSAANDTPDRRKNGRREMEADEGVGEKKESSAPIEFPPADESGLEPARQSEEATKEKHRAPDPPSDPPAAPDCRVHFQTGPWLEQEPRPQEGEDEDDEDFVEDFDLDFEYSREECDETEEGVGRGPPRPPLGSPDFAAAGSDGSWTSVDGGQSATSTAALLPLPASPPMPSSSSSGPLSGAVYAGKVHLCHCGKAYTLKSMRDRHVKMQHLNLRPFGCPICSKSFKMKHHLTKHLKTHGGLRPYECGVCGKKVIWRDSFLRHQARCQRLACSGAAAPPHGAGGFGFCFEDAEGFIPAGEVKVEDGDLREMDDGMGGAVEQLGAENHNQNPLSHVFKQEAAESFSGT